MMAKEAFQKLEEQLTCAVCFDTYTDPKQLQCNHIFCQKCLVRLLDRDKTGQLTISCPNCRQVTPISASSGVAGLQAAFHINHLLEIRDTLSMIHSGTAFSGVCGLTDSSDTPLKAAMCCLEHSEELKLFCGTCEMLICCQCAIKGNKHHHHDYELVEKAFERYERDFTFLLEPMEKKLATFSTVLEEVNGRCKEISDQQAGIETGVSHMIRELHEVLDIRRTQLIHSVHKIAAKKLKTLAAQKDHLEFSQIRLRSCLEFLRGSMKDRPKGDKLKMKMTLVTQVKELASSFESDTLKTDVEADITYNSASPDNIIKLLQNHGEVFTPRSLCPKKCQALGDFEVATVGKKSYNLIQAFNWKGSPCKEPIELLQCELISELTGGVVIGFVERKGQGQYEISYEPTINGRHQLHVKVEDRHIRGSPFAIAVKVPVAQLDAPILTILGICMPWGVAVNKKGMVFVTEGNANRVSVISPRGEKLLSFGSYGSDPGQFDNPRGVAITGDGDILVVDRNNNRIQKFSEEGQFLTAVGSEGKGHLEFIHPRGVVFNPANSKIYVTDYNHRVQILNSDLTFSSTFGRRGSSKGHFDCPCGLACDGAGKIYVADTGNRWVQVFTQDGKFIRGLGQSEEKGGELNCPVGVAVDSSGNVYVSEFTNRPVSVFTPEGKFVARFGKEGRGPGEFIRPLNLAVDRGALYVCDDDRIQIF